MSNTMPNQPVTANPEPTQPQPKRPNEQGSFSVEAHVRIFDPKTREVYMEGRA
jgi:hypothetical protein